MELAEALAHIDRLSSILTQAGNDIFRIQGAKLQIAEFVKVAVGESSNFYVSAKNVSGGADHNRSMLGAILQSLRAHLEGGLQDAKGVERRAQIDVVSDFLDQAQTLLNSNGVHPAAPIVIVGAALEEFLRTWVEEKGLKLNGNKRSLETYSQALAQANLITKQDGKDITSWAGLRNHAAHGEWGEVSEKQRASIMLDGVNLFMRKYGA